jgi:WXG100 family type VII secretion target
MTSFAINPDVVQQIVEDFRGLTAKLATKLDELNGPVNAYLEQNVGETADHFRNAQGKWTTNAAGMQESLQAGGNNLTEIVERYKRNDVGGAGLFA